MVTAIGSNSKVFDMSQLPKACRPIDAKNSREESDKTALSLGIKLEDATIINISPCSASFLLQKSGNFEQFKSAKINQLRSETITISAIDVTINNYDEYASQRSEFESKVQSTDFEQEYKDYMKSRGCKNEEELQALNNTMYKTMDDLKRGAASGMTSVMMNMAIRNPEMTSARHNINSIISSSKCK
ncbi:MAG: hypothetical protein MZV64_26840 [Ignavibacteriales bacterium]|nr:hypothetical protein [Ignavibacteriales bacterium]